MSPAGLPGAWHADACVGIGLMSGTSADGIDAAGVLFPADGMPLLLQFESHPYPPDVRRDLFAAFEDRLSVSSLCRLNGRVGEVFAEAGQGIGLALQRLGHRPSFVASHGQTVWHIPPGAQESIGATLQIGEAARIAARLALPVVSDFRQQDMALGGHGAPLVPLADFLLLTHPTESRAVQNLGGIGNVTYLAPSGTLDQVRAFDTGPANCLIDRAAELASGGSLRCDLDGRLAAAGKVDHTVLAALMQHHYFLLPPPKSTGRELFRSEMVAGLWSEGLRGPDLVSTLTQFTVESIRQGYAAWLPQVDGVVLGGGGARNPELVRRLERALAPTQILKPEPQRFRAEAREAVAFALLGYRTLRGESGNVPTATGASRRAILGKITLP